MVGSKTAQGIKSAEANSAAHDPEFPVMPEFRQQSSEVSPTFEETDPGTKETYHIGIPQRGRPVPVSTLETHGPVEYEGCAEEHSSDQAEEH